LLPQHHREGRADTLQELRTHIPLDIREVPTGTAVFDWNIPLEWNIHDACIKNGRGEKVVDFAKSNLHDMSYSLPVRQLMPLSELKARIYTVPISPISSPIERPVTENRAFCMAHRQFECSSKACRTEPMRS
jgi:aminopeptidase-like protein